MLGIPCGLKIQEMNSVQNNRYIQPAHEKDEKAEQSDSR